MTNKELEKMLIKLDAVLSLMQDIYEVLAEEATRVEVEEDAPSDSL
jgi:hypothetical protein